MFSYTGHITRYYPDAVYPRKPSDAMERAGSFWEIAFYRRLLKMKGWELDAIAGIQYRHGLEFALRYIFYGEIHSTWYSDKRYDFSFFQNR